jgi:AbrB family looped-hinge helix DNA binding protein
METYATTKGQVVIPAALRRKYGIKAGTKLIVTEQDNGILLKPVTEESLKALQGALKGQGVLKALLDARKEDVERE